MLLEITCYTENFNFFMYAYIHSSDIRTLELRFVTTCDSSSL